MNKNVFEEDMKFIIDIQNKRKNNLSHDISNYENFEKLYFFDNEKLHDLIHKTEAWKLYADFEDIEYIIKRMKKCISNFKETAEKFLNEEKKDYEEDFIEISYLFTSYTYTIYKIREVLSTKYPVDAYSDKLNSVFSIDAVGHLIKAIRHTSVHRTLYKPRWHIEYTFPGKEIYIMIDKKLFLKDDNLNNKKAINKTYGKNINIIDLFEQYIQKVELFHKWHKEKIYSNYSDKIEEYKKYSDWFDKLNIRSTEALKNQISNGSTC